MKNLWIIPTFLLTFLAGALIGYQVVPSFTKKAEKQNPFEAVQQEMTAVQDEVLPKEGFKTKISLGDTIPKLVEGGAIDMEKFTALYERRGGLTDEQKKMLTDPSDKPITIDEANASFLLNLLWPLGIANKTVVLAESEAGKPENVNNLAATGGWTLGKKENGGEYYNTLGIIKLTDEQEKLVKLVASNIFRPCCGNSTAFPDCNHGAALLAVLELGASQGLTENELYEEALKFNKFWFPEQYFQMAMAFKYVNKTPMAMMDPKTLLSEQYSSGSGFQRNVAMPLSKMPGMGGSGHGGGGAGCSA